MRLAAPLALVVVLPLFALLVFALHRAPVTRSRSRHRVYVACALVAAVATSLAVLGLELAYTRDATTIVLLVDRSRSTDSGDREIGARLAEAKAALAQMRAEDRVGIVVTATESETVLAPSPRTQLPRVRADIARESSDLERGIRHALADVPEGTAARIVLLTDGLETHGDAIAAASAASARGVSVDVVPITRTPTPELAVESVRAPTHVAPREPVAIRVVTRSTHAARVRLRLRRDGDVIAVGETSVGAGHDLLLVRDAPEAPGLHRYDVELEPLDANTDTSRANDEGAAFVRVEGTARVLLVARSEEVVAPLVEAVRENGGTPVFVPPTGMPHTLAELAAFDLVVLADVEARSLTEAQLDDLAGYVRDLGGGLLMVGARQSFGLGGYSGTPVEEVMPVTFDLRRRRDRLSLALVIAIDRSGSMSVPVDATRTKLDLANEAAARSAMLLAPSDRVAIAHVDTEVHWTQPMTRVDSPASIARAARRATSGGGGIFVDITLDAAYQALDREQTQLSHLILFSDGDDSEQIAGCRARVTAAYGRHITTSVVSMGDGVDTPELEVLARLGHGRFYIVEDMTQLPRIFTQETMEASRAGVAEKVFVPAVVEPGPAISGIDFTRAPPLRGLALVEARPAATVHLRAAADEPLLARWQHGLGRSAVFTADLGGELSRDWLAWPGFRAMLGQLVRDLSRRESPDDADVRVEIVGGRGRLWVEAIDETGRFRNHLELDARIASPRGGTSRVRLSQTSPGLYEATFDASVPGPYLATVRDGEDGLVGTVGAVRAFAAELTGEGTDHARIAEIASAGSGLVRTDLRDLFTLRGAPLTGYVPLAPHLLPIALVALLASVAARRLTFVPPSVKRLFRRASRTEPSPAPVALEALANAQRTRRDGTPKVTYAPRDDAPSKPSMTKTTAAPPPTTEPVSPTAEPTKTPASLAERLLEQKRKR